MNQIRCIAMAAAWRGADWPQALRSDSNKQIGKCALLAFDGSGLKSSPWCRGSLFKGLLGSPAGFPGKISYQE